MTYSTIASSNLTNDSSYHHNILSCCAMHTCHIMATVMPSCKGLQEATPVVNVSVQTTSSVRKQYKQDECKQIVMSSIS